MKDMEIKTENRYEYRKTQEKRKQMIAPDLFEFAYVPDWYGHLAELERLALPESWRFRKPSRETKNTETPILERYIHTIFRKQVIDFNSESDPRKADSIFHLENECVCFHTGLYTPQYKGIYGYFERNNFSDSLRDWYFRGFCDELSPKLRYIEPLPQKPVYHMAQSGINFNPEWPIRVNVNHILGDEENLERIPAKIRKVKNLPLLFETAVELGRRKSVIEPGLVVPQGYQGRVQYLLPVYLTNMQKPDLAMTLTVMDGYYLGNTYASSFSKTSNADLRSDPSLYTVEMRIRGNKVRVYSGAAYTLRFTATITAETGYVGFMAEKGVVCDLLRLGDAWYYEPYECFDITFPDGKQTTFGRCTRTGISWDNEFELFRVNSDVEEISTRSQDISMDYDFFHSHEMSLECGSDYEMKVVPHDLNVWLSRMYLGDADGFSIMYYSDVDSIVYWANEAAYTYGVSGIAIWSLGQEDMRLWDSMPNQI